MKKSEEIKDIIFLKLELFLKENPQYKQLFSYAKKYSAKGRWWDLWHVYITTQNMLFIIENENLRYRTKILIPAAMFHDIGWSKIGEEKNNYWDNNDLRVKHMEVGSSLAKDILLNENYPKKDGAKIIDLIAHHDDEYLGKPPDALPAKILRDADASFILSYPSFWKDFYIKGKSMQSKDFFEEQVKNYGARYTKSAQVIVNKQIKERYEEIASGVITPEQRYIKILEMAKRMVKEVK